MDRDDAERWEGQRWGAPKPLWTGEALTTLHPETPGMDRWVRDPFGGWYPDCCDAHRPKEIVASEIEMLQRMGVTIVTDAVIGSIFRRKDD